MRTPSDTDAKTVSTDFLSLVNAHVMEQLNRQLGRVAVKQTVIRFVITLPAK
jgi:hypothetical protein